MILAAPVSARCFLVLALLTLAIEPTNAQSPSIEGHWEGEAIREGARLPITIDFFPGDSGVRGTFTSPSQRVMDYPLDSVTVSSGIVQFGVGGGSLEFEGRFSAEGISGILREGGAEGEFSLRRAGRISHPYTQTDVTFQNGTAVLAGSLFMPPGEGPFPAVVLVHGSGSETRWGTSRFLADQFARAGIAALIYDKRGTGESTGDWRYSTYEELADDALAAVRLLAVRNEIDSSNIGIRGHSEGGMIAPLAASRAPGLFGFIVAAATYPESVWQIDLFRVGQSIQRSDFTDEKRETLGLYELFLEVARGVRPMEDLESASDPVQEERWYQWLGIPPRDNWLWNWYRWVGNFRSLPSWETVQVPVLLLYGERDVLVHVEDSIRLIEDALRRAGNRDYTPVIVPRASHGLTISSEEGEPFEWWRVAPGIIDLEIGWILHRATPDSTTP